MGGLVRVDLKRLDEADMALAFSLAKESYNSEVKFDTWSLLNKRKDRKRTK